MKHLLTLALCALALSACRSSASNPPPHADAATTSAEHRWLEQFVGDWRIRTEAKMGADQPPMQMESTESVRSIGGLWVLGEGSADFDGAPYTSLLTLGYDSAKQCFVGTWVDTMQTHLWTYRGQLDAAGTVLTLEAEGPDFLDPSRFATYRDTFEIVDASHRRLTSSVRGPDGAWTEFMHAEYERVK